MIQPTAYAPALFASHCPTGFLPADNVRIPLSARQPVGHPLQQFHLIISRPHTLSIIPRIARPHTDLPSRLFTSSRRVAPPCEYSLFTVRHPILPPADRPNLRPPYCASVSPALSPTALSGFPHRLARPCRQPVIPSAQLPPPGRRSVPSPQTKNRPHFCGRPLYYSSVQSTG